MCETTLKLSVEAILLFFEIRINYFLKNSRSGFDFNVRNDKIGPALVLIPERKGYIPRMGVYTMLLTQPLNILNYLNCLCFVWRGVLGRHMPVLHVSILRK